MVMVYVLTQVWCDQQNLGRVMLTEVTKETTVTIVDQIFWRGQMRSGKIFFFK